MFLRTKKSVLDQVQKEDAQLASIFRAINELYKMANFKLSYVNNLLRNYNVNRFYSKMDESKKFLESNTAILEKVEDLISSEKKLESDEKYRKHIFAREIENLDEALKLLKKIRHLIKREINLIISLKKFDEEAKSFEMKEQFSKVYRIMSLIAKCVKREVNLLEIESSKIIKVDQEIRRLDVRIKKNRRMPIVKSRYYHASRFIFNVGDKLKPSGPIERCMRIEKIFEEVRKKDFPDKPSRFDCIYVTDDIRSVEAYGVVYAVEVHGIVHKTDQEVFTEAVFHPEYAEEHARDYWQGGEGTIPEVLVKGKVIIIGLADYIKVGDKIQIIVSGLEDDDGNSVAKGSVGVIEHYDKAEEDLPFVTKMNNGTKISLPPVSFKVIK